MTAIIFDGKSFAQKKEERLMRDLGEMGKIPKLVAILIGDNPESELYVKLKRKVAERLGIGFEIKKFSGESPVEIASFIEEKNNDPEVSGIIVELPLPKKFKVQSSKFKIIEAINPKKDVDCLTSENLRLLAEGKPKFVPPTVKAVGEIIKNQKSKCKNQKKERKVVVVGSEGVVGKGILSYLRHFGNLSNLRGIDKETKNLEAVTKTADILISATGVGHLIKKEMVEEGVMVIDVGIEKQSNGKLLGDVDFENVKEVASFITPVPGGVGPVTIICLMENLVQSVYH